MFMHLIKSPCIGTKRIPKKDTFPESERLRINSINTPIELRLLRAILIISTS